VIVALFDLEGTLVQSIETDQAAIREFRAKTREKIVELGVPRSELEGIETSTLTRKRAAEYVEARFSRKDAEWFNLELDRFLKGYELHWADKSKLYSDALPALWEMRNLGYRMGLVTNTSREAADRMLSKHGISSFFEVVIARNDVKKIKPDPEGIILALKRLKAQDFLFIGDLVYDSEAAGMAGGKVIIINRNLSMKVEFHADHVVNALTEVPEIIQQVAKKHKY